MADKRVRELLRDKGAVGADLFCTVHRFSNGLLATVYSSHSEPERLGGWQHIDEGIVGVAARTRSPYNCPDTHQDANYSIAYPDIRSELAVPIVAGPHLDGIINFESTSVNHFDEVREGEFQRLAYELATFFFIGRSEPITSLLIPESLFLSAVIHRQRYGLQ